MKNPNKKNPLFWSMTGNSPIVIHRGGMTFCVTGRVEDASEITGVSSNKIKDILEKNSKGSWFGREGLYTKDRNKESVYYEFYYLEDADRQLYATGGVAGHEHLLNACIGQVVKFFSQISSIKDHFVADNKLIIVFDHELMTQDVDAMQSILANMPECHDVMNDYLDLGYTENHNSVRIGLKVNAEPTFARGGDIMGKTMHEFKEGKLRSSSGDKVTNRKQAIAIGLSKERSGKFDEGGTIPKQLDSFPNEIEHWNGKYTKALVTPDFTFYVNFEEGDENANTLMYRNDGSLVSDNYFANEGLMDELMDEDQKYIFIHKNIYDYLDEYRNN